MWLDQDIQASYLNLEHVPPLLSVTVIELSNSKFKLNLA